MLNFELIEERLDQIRVSVNRLKKMKSMSLEEFLLDPDYFAISEHHLRRSLEALFDIGRHIIAKNGFGKPENYKQILDILGQQRIITPEFSKKIGGMAGYRNRLVHGYAKVSPEEIYNIIQTKLDDFVQFCIFIVKFIDSQAKCKR